MEDLIGKAHAYLDNKGCKSMGQQYTAFEIEKMLADFAQQQLNLLTMPDVIKSVCDNPITTEDDCNVLAKKKTCDGCRWQTVL